MSTSAVSFAAAAGGMAAPPRSLWRDAWARLRRNRLAKLCLAVVALYVVVALAGFTPHLQRAASEMRYDSYELPSWRAVGLWLGADHLGRSVLWRLLYGTRIALTVAVSACLISIFVGTTLGLIAGYFGRWIDSLVIWLFSTVNSVPAILLMIAMAYALQGFETLKDRLSGMPIVVLALGLTGWVGLCRLIRGEVMRHRERDYVVAARAAGAGHLRIMFRHILPNVFHLIIIDFSLGMVGCVQAEVALAFLGLGITDRPSWGRMIDDAKLELLRGVWWQVAAATAAIFILCLALNILGDALRDALDPRLRGTD